jgi:hypothetical protein
MHEMALMRAEIKQLRGANENLSKRRRAKIIRLRNGGSLSIQAVEDLRAGTEAVQKVMQEIKAGSGQELKVKTRVRRCDNCGKSGNNTRMCQVVVVSDQ